MNMQLPEKIILCEVGLRDGLQNEAVKLKTEDKIALANEIIAAGFPVIELGSFVSPKAVPQMADTDAVFKALGEQKAEMRALIANKRGVDRAVACGCKKVKLNVSASRAHNLANLNMTPEESVAGFTDCVAAAKAEKITISGSISMPFGSPWERNIPLEDVCAITEAYLAVGIDEISLSDASGMGVPNRVYAICKEMQARYPQVTWWLHFHNTRGTGLANIVAAMQTGITRFDTSFAGVGGCPFVPGAAGNVVSEDVVHLCDEMGLDTGVDIDKAIAIANWVVKLVGHNTDSYILRAGKSGDLIRELPSGQIKNQTQKKIKE